MAYTRKFPFRKQNQEKKKISLHAYGKHSHSSVMQPDWYCVCFVQCSERRRRTIVEGIETGFNQLLPVETDRLWPLSKSKIPLQELFTQWTLKKIESECFEKHSFPDGSRKEDMSYKLIIRVVTAERLLKCTHKEANDRIWFHANHVMIAGRYYSLIIESPDKDNFVTATHHFNKLKYFNLD